MRKLIVYVPTHRSYSWHRLRTVVKAAKKVAEQLGISLEGAYPRSDIPDIAVYYQGDNGGEEWIYDDWEPNRSEEAVYNLMFSLTDVLRSLAKPSNWRFEDDGIVVSS